MKSQALAGGSINSSKRNHSIRLAIFMNCTVLMEAMSLLLSSEEDIEIVEGGKPDGGILDLVRSRDLDVVLLKPSGCASDALDVISRIASLDRKIGILLFEARLDEYLALRMLRAGAHGFLSGSIDSAELKRAVRTVERGEIYLTPEMQRVCAEKYLNADSVTDPKDLLSDRELQVMRFLALGSTNREIASMLRIGIKTIDTHRANMLRKLKLRNNSDVTRFAIAHQIISI